jgi:hypothetical protein
MQPVGATAIEADIAHLLPPFLPPLPDQMMLKDKEAGLVYLHLSRRTDVLKKFRALVWRSVTLTNNASIIADIAIRRKQSVHAMQGAPTATSKNETLGSMRICPGEPSSSGISQLFSTESSLPLHEVSF